MKFDVREIGMFLNSKTSPSFVDDTKKEVLMTAIGIEMEDFE